MRKETNTYEKRDQYIWEKRPIYMKKETNTNETNKYEKKSTTE